MIWAYLLHLSFNMWEEAGVRIPAAAAPATRWAVRMRKARPELRVDDRLWAELLERMCEAGLNMVVLDLGDAIRYESHPELAVLGAWSPRHLQRELKRMRDLGLEPIPKLNFSAGHDHWLGPYARCVSTPAYYAVCRDLIREVSQSFGHPRFFHLGMDEETAAHQRFYEYVVVRQGELWWHDLYFLQREVERGGSRAWVWSDYIWGHRDKFLQKMPCAILQSNWYYGEQFRKTDPYVAAYLELEARGYDQLPAASTWSSDASFPNTVRYCRSRIAPDRLLGFMQCPWLPTVRAYRRRLMRAIDVVGETRRNLRLPR